MLWFVVSLSACGSKDQNADDQGNTSGNVVVNNDVDTNMVDTDDADIKTDLDEYQLNFDLVSTDKDGKEMHVNMDVYQKGDKVLYVMNEMPVEQDMPIITHKSLTTNGKNYVQMEVKGTTNWFVAQGVDQTALADQMFNLKKMQSELTKDAKKVTHEKIDGKKMTCYYRNDGIEEGKACTYKGVFAYAESDMLDGSKIHTVMKITNYKEKVKDSIFDEPTDAKDMTELMGMMGG